MRVWWFPLSNIVMHALSQMRKFFFNEPAQFRCFFNFFLFFSSENSLCMQTTYILLTVTWFFSFSQVQKKNSLSFALFYEWKMKWKIGSAARDMLRWRWVMKCVYHMIFLTFALISFSYYFTSALSFTFFSHHHAWYRFFVVVIVMHDMW